MTHTPGPWRISHDKRGRIHEIETVEQDPPGYRHLTNRLPMGSFDRSTTNDAGDSFEMIANAHLMAAAPELLAALEALRPFFEGEHAHDHPHCVQMRAAIAKAKS